MVTSQVSGDYMTSLARKRMAAGVLLTDESGRVLLVEPTYKAYWEIPGGAVDADESPYDAAARELKEELGLSVSPGRLLVVDWVPPRPGRTEGLLFVFDGGRLSQTQTAKIILPPGELAGWEWCTLDEARERLSDLLARRLEAALRARSDRHTSYLESGHHV